MKKKAKKTSSALHDHHVFAFLGSKVTQGSRLNEYRLLVSGTLYNSAIQTSDFTKSDATRWLCTTPFSLHVVSRPFDSYPQELALTFRTSCKTETRGLFTTSSHFDSEIANDLAALLTLYSRRLITVLGKTRETEASDKHYLPKGAQGGATNFFNEQTPIYWERSPARLITTQSGTAFHSTDPAAVGIKPKDLTHFLKRVAQHSHANEILEAARQYHFALRLLKAHPEVSYPTLISAIETLANSVYADKEFTAKEIATPERMQEFSKAANAHGIAKKTIRQLYLIAQKNSRKWSIGQKFRHFLTVFGKEVHTKMPYIFPDAEHQEQLVPPNENFAKDIKNVYGSRSAASHGGGAFPPYITIGFEQRIEIATVQKLIEGKTNCPTLLWFERVVASSLHIFILQH